MIMIKAITRRIAPLLVCMTLIPGAVLCEEEDMASWMASMEARVAALEAQMQGLEAQPEGVDGQAASGAFTLGETLELEPGRTITIRDFDTGSRFKYSPSGGLSMLTLSAKQGYRLLCLYVRVENNTQQDFYTARLLDSTVTYGKDYLRAAQDTFFYLNGRGLYAGGLRAVGAGATVDGCLLFAVPADIDTSGERIAVQLTYDSTDYECELRAAGPLPIPEEGESF